MDVVEFNAPVRPEAIIAVEFDANYCREAGTMVANDTALINTVLGQVTASGLYAPINFSATDGTQNAAAVALYPSDSDGNVTVEKRGPAILRADMLVWPVGATNNQIAAAIAQLAALGILARATG